MDLSAALLGRSPLSKLQVRKRATPNAIRATPSRNLTPAQLGRVRDLDRGALVLGRVAWGSPLAGFDASLGSWRRSYAENGSVYWWNKETRETSWEDPREAPAKR